MPTRIHQLRFGTRRRVGGNSWNQGVQKHLPGPQIASRAGSRTPAVAGVSSSFPVPKHNIGMPQPFLSRLLSVFTIFPGEAANPQTASTVLRVPQIPQPSFSSVVSILSQPHPLGRGAAPTPSPQRRVPSHGLAGHQGAGEHPLSPSQPLGAVPGSREQRVLPVGSIRPLRPWGHPRGPAKTPGC